MVLAGLFGLLLPDLASGVSGSQRWLGHLDPSAHTMVADAPVAGRGRDAESRHPAELLAVVTSPCARVSSVQSDPQHPDAPIPMEAPESGLGSVEADDELGSLDDFAYHLRVVFDGTAQLNRIVEPGMSLGGRALSRLEDDRNHKPPRS